MKDDFEIQNCFAFMTQFWLYFQLFFIIIYSFFPNFVCFSELGYLILKS